MWLLVKHKALACVIKTTKEEAFQEKLLYYDLIGRDKSDANQEILLAQRNQLTVV